MLTRYLESGRAGGVDTGIDVVDVEGSSVAGPARLPSAMAPAGSVVPRSPVSYSTDSHMNMTHVHGVSRLCKQAIPRVLINPKNSQKSYEARSPKQGLLRSSDCGFDNT